MSDTLECSATLTMSDARLACELQGNTLRVYWYLINSSKTSVGPRDVQRKLGFSSELSGLSFG